MPEIIFSKKISKYEILNHLYILVQISFLGTALGHFSQCFFVFVFFSFSSLGNHGDPHFYSVPHLTMKKFPSALLHVHNLVICS